MGVYNGAAALPEQLESFVAQTHLNWQLYVSDDDSTDGSMAILRSFAAKRKIVITQGPGRGFAQNFLSLIAGLPDNPGYTALSDQDDVWLPEKLSTALAALSAHSPDQPAMYCGRRLNWDPVTGTKSPSRLYRRAPGFANALVENIAGGNTIVLNPAAARLARDLAATTGDIYAHDWWLYLLITGVGGTVIYDPTPHVLYRQHVGNVIGAGEGIANSLRNKIGVLRGAYSDRVTRNLTAMQAVHDHLTPPNQKRLATFAKARKTGITTRLFLLRQSGVYRQSRLSGAGLWGAACLGRI